MRRLYWLIIICLCLFLSSAPVWAASEESAKQAVAKAFPDVSFAQAAAIFQLLTTLQDGDTSVIMINGTGASFHADGDSIVVGGKPGTPGAPATGTTAKPQTVVKPPTHPPTELPARNSALVYSIATKPLDLDLFRAEVARNGHNVVATTDDSVTFLMGANTDIVTLTTDGTICVRSAEPLDSLDTVDLLEAEAAGAMSYLQKVNASVTDGTVAAGLRGHIYYSNPPYTHKQISFLGQTPNQRWMSSRFRSALRIPDIEVKEARLSLRFLRRRDVFSDWSWVAPTITIDGAKVIRPSVGKRSYTADITDLLTPGEHALGVKVEQGQGTATGSEFGIAMIVAAGAEADFEAVVRGETITSSSSQPLEAITRDWEALAGAL